MRKVNDNERRIPDLGTHDVVDDSGTPDVTHINELVTNPLFHRGLHNVLHKRVKFGVPELHGDEAVIPLKFTAFLRLVLFPSVEGEINVEKANTPAYFSTDLGFDDAGCFQIFGELRDKFLTGSVNDRTKGIAGKINWFA